MVTSFQAPPIGFEPMGYKVPSRSQGECLRPDSTTMALRVILVKVSHLYLTAADSQVYNIVIYFPY